MPGSTSIVTLLPVPVPVPCLLQVVRFPRMEDFPSGDLAVIERTTQEVGRYVFEHLSRRQPTMLQRRWWDDRIMAWAMQDESVKVQMFRFIDVLPMLRESQSVTRHLHEYFQEV